jgi:hypothetical protein
MLERNSWWPAAERLEMGQRRRVPHDCGEGSPLMISRSSDGYRAWCFRCVDGDSRPPPQETLAERLQRFARMREGDSTLGGPVGPGVGELPMPRVLEVAKWPLEGRVWLYKAGLSNADIGRLGIYYHPPSDRVVVPVYEAGVPVFYQARAYQPNRFPKYLGPTPKPPRLLPVWGAASSPTLTEDLLSAIKVGLVGEGCAVLGTSASAHLVATLLKRARPVNVWLDPDEAGQRGARKLCKQLRAYGLTVRNIVSAKDPKLHTREEIKEYLNV